MNDTQSCCLEVGQALQSLQRVCWKLKAAAALYILGSVVPVGLQGSHKEDLPVSPAWRNLRRRSSTMAPYDIRTYQEKDQKHVLDLFSRGMDEHIPTTFCYMLRLPGILLLELGVPLSLFLFSGSWLLAVMSSLTLLLFLWFLARYTWKQYQVICLHTDLADITKTYLSASDSCFWVAESGGQVVGTVCALPVENPTPGKKQLQLFHLSVAMEHRGVGMAKALTRTAFQFARNQGYDEVVLETSMMQRSALALYQAMGFQRTGHYYMNIVWKLTKIPVFQLLYHLPSAQDG